MTEELDNPRTIMRLYTDKVFGFDIALKLLKAGYRVHRKSWNGQGMWLCLQKGYPDGIPINKNTAQATGVEEGTVCAFSPYLMIKTANATATFAPWVPSQTDIIAEDWMASW